MGTLASKEAWEKAALEHGLELVAEPQCPMSGETWAPGTMAWVRSDDYRRPVSAIAACGCGLCGERPARPGSDCCAECLESAPTMRGTELESMGGAL